MSLSSFFFISQDPAWYQTHGITYLTGARVTAADVSNKVLTLAGGKTVRFEKLVVATGVRPTTLVDIKARGRAASVEEKLVLNIAACRLALQHKVGSSAVRPCVAAGCAECYKSLSVQAQESCSVLLFGSAARRYALRRCALAAQR